MPLGLRERFIVPEAEKMGLKVFSLACGHSDKTRFALELIRKHDLRPKVVVASGGPHIFREGMSEVARQAMSMTRWQAMRKRLEVAGSWALLARLHTHVPRIDFFRQKLVSPWIIYRSARTGWWRPALEPNGRHPIRFAKERGNYRDLLPLARELKDDLDRRGALLVLTMVPYGDTRVGHLPYLATELGVPSVVPDFEDIFMADGSHLDRESAQRISIDFWQRFIALEPVRSRLALGAN
jgi:hypothetical protein